ncbi:MAG: hypothetical protein Kapaf2KO_02870 [Candidatus Kapaibacteriales bacterium]
MMKKQLNLLKYRTLPIAIFAIAVLISSFTDTQSQDIKVSRIDVDSTRSGIITAGYGFELKIDITGLTDVNNVSFELTHDSPDEVFYSEYVLGDFSNTDYVFVRPPRPGEGSLTVAVFNPNSQADSSLSDPHVITLRYVVAKSAQNEREVKFNFNNALSSSRDSVGEPLAVTLNSSEISLNIHGFVEVWPGETNGDGTVDIIDQNTVGLYLGQGSLTPNMRSYRRKQPSTRFYPQNVLLWDKPEMTYADCDGDGDVTVQDGMVVFFNEGKIVGVVERTEEENIPSTNQENNYPGKIHYSESLDPTNSTKLFDKKQGINELQVLVRPDRNFKSAVIELAGTESKLVDVENGDMFGSGFSYLGWQEESKTEVLLGEFGGISPKPEAGIIGRLFFEGSELPEVVKVIGMDETGQKFDISFDQIASIVEYYNYSDVIEDEIIESIIIYTPSGQLVGKFQNRTQVQSQLHPGLYFYHIHYQNGTANVEGNIIY